MIRPFEEWCKLLFIYISFSLKSKRKHFSIKHHLDIINPFDFCNEMLRHCCRLPIGKSLTIHLKITHAHLPIRFIFYFELEINLEEKKPLYNLIRFLTQDSKVFKIFRFFGWSEWSHAMITGTIRCFCIEKYNITEYS